jgi:hypothetical protein
MLPRCRLAILPGTTHASLPQRAALLAPMVEEFLDEDPQDTGSLAAIVDR